MAPSDRNKALKLLPDAKVTVVVLDGEAKKVTFETDDLAIVMITPTTTFNSFHLTWMFI